MDVSIFRQLKQEWRKAINKWKVNNEGKRLLRESFAPLMDEVLSGLSSDNYINGFRACGLFPWNPNALNYNKYFKLSETSFTTEISKEVAKFHLKFLEKEIGELKLKRFMEENVESEDIALHRLWKKLRTSEDENNEAEDVPKEDKEEEKDKNELNEDLTEENEVEERNKESNKTIGNDLEDTVTDSDKHHEVQISPV